LALDVDLRGTLVAILGEMAGLGWGYPLSEGRGGVLTLF